jgi:glycosyltransferase involved in cell wall biosynthesis
MKLQMYQILDKQALRFFDRVVPLSSQIVKSLPFRNPKKVVLIKNFIDLSTLPPPAPFDGRLVSFIGRLTPLKRMEDAIEALRFVNDREIRLQIIGDGRLRQPLEGLVERLGLDDRVSFLGFRADALDLLNGSAALVVPSLTEGISRVAMEAMALGKPVIGTDIPGNRELIKHGETGLIVPVRNPEAIAAAMGELLGDQARYQSISRSAKDFIEANHSAARAVKRYEELYGGLMSADADRSRTPS